MIHKWKNDDCSYYQHNLNSMTTDRPLKQIIERLNRTFKRSYKTTNSFNSFNGSISIVFPDFNF
jgi:hypothetical protein